MTSCKVVIDTDAGVDDAVALFLALAAHKDQSKNFEILGITTVLGNTGVDYVCRNVGIVLEYAGIEIPVYRGAANPLVQPFNRDGPPFHGEDGFGDINLEDISMKENTKCLQDEFAALALVRLARQHKGELTVIALGPLTNLAIAIKIDPDFSSNVKDIYIMGGNIHGIGNIRTCSEFNFFVDPEAVFVVLAAPWRNKMILIPWETCRFATSSLEWRKNALGTIKSKQITLLNLIEKTYSASVEERYDTWVCADALCVAVLLNPNIVTKRSSKYCTMELSGFHTRGQMVVDHAERSGMEHNAETIENVNVSILEEMLIATFDPSTFPQ